VADVDKEGVEEEEEEVKAISTPSSSLFSL